MTKLEQLKAASDAADAAWGVASAAYDAAEAAYVAYRDELKKTQKEQTNEYAR